MSSQLAGKTKRNVEQLKRFQAFEIQIARLLGGWLPGIRNWEVKQEVGLHIWQNAENSRDLRTRLWELRVTDPDRDVEHLIMRVFRQLARAQHDYEMLSGIYLVLKSELLAAYRNLAGTTYDVYDYPTIPMLKGVISINQMQVERIKPLLATLTDSGEKKRKAQRWMQFTKDVLDSIGGVSGDQTPREESPTPPPAYDSLLPFARARRDGRFDLQASGMPMPDEGDRATFTLWQFVNYGMEMQAAETLATCLWEVEGMPWEFYHDLARHCWDEVRHSQLGCHRLEQLGHHISDFSHSVGSYAWRQLFDPVVRYCALTYVIEAGSFKLKHDTYQKYLETGDVESAQAVMHDILDETMHVRWGKKWVPELMRHYGYAQSLEELVSQCREIVARHTVAPAQKEAAERDIHKRGR